MIKCHNCKQDKPTDDVLEVRNEEKTYWLCVPCTCDVLNNTVGLKKPEPKPKWRCNS